MRNGQNKRMRGRHQHHHHHRKNQNPLTRVYESNGPEVKIRGTASHIAEKYVQLARDAMASGDPVTAENHHQHAEHYFRLIAAAQEQFRQQNPYYRPENEARDDNQPFGEIDEGGDEAGQGQGANFGNQPMPQQGQPYPPREPQPYGNREGQPYQQNRPQQPQHNQHQSPQQPQHAQPAMNEGTDGERLPAFVTGGGQPQNNFNSNGGSYDQGGDRGDRYQRHHRRRRHRGHHRGDMNQGAGESEGAHPDGD